MAIVAFGLSVIAGDVPFVATSGFVLAASLLGASIATRRERQED